MYGQIEHTQHIWPEKLHRKTDQFNSKSAPIQFLWMKRHSPKFSSEKFHFLFPRFKTKCSITWLVVTTLQSILLTQFLTSLMLCVLILYISGGTESLNSTPNDSFFEKLFMAVLIYSQSFCQKSAERKSPKKYFLYFVRSDVKTWGSNPGFTSNKPRHYLLDYGDFNVQLVWIKLLN